MFKITGKFKGIPYKYTIGLQNEFESDSVNRESKTMVVHNILHMNSGDGETSYANNSGFQKKLILKARRLVDETVKNMFISDRIPINCFKVADLGCSSGPNTFLAISGIINAVHESCKQINHESPEFQVFLNDLPENDFNTIFKSTPSFYEELKKEENLGRVFITGVPGSFYGRLFPSKSLDFVHSSNSLHWLSQVPDGIENNNKGSIYITKRSPPSVLTAYKKQFERDFQMFLSARAEELVSGGCMVLEFGCRGSPDPTCRDRSYHLQLLADSLLEMAAEGLVEESEVDSFNMPYYAPFKEEVREIIEEEGSFNIEKLEPFEIDGDAVIDEEHKSMSAKVLADRSRAVMEPMITCHFGESSTIIQDLFTRFGKRIVEYHSREPVNVTVLTISLIKK